MGIQKLITLPAGMASSFHRFEKKEEDSWISCSDPVDHQLGSGGGTAYILAEAYKRSGSRAPFRSWLISQQRLIIHSGGQSRRLPAYAPYGKSLLPLPVFRWTKGQYLDQKLLDFQASYYERILKGAPGSYCTLIGSGDVMFISSDRFSELPEADVLIFGIWVEDETASRHGVFFSRREEQDHLAFVRQKPSLRVLRDYSADFFYLMDSGIVLMNETATMKLMEKSGWDPSRDRFSGDLPRAYDLYGEMLTAFGTEADSKDPDLHELKVKLVPLHHGEFYHFGSNQDLIASVLRLQNRVVDQRLRFTRQEEHHPSVFQQNSDIGVKFTTEHHHIWIENACLPDTWKLNHHHIITGIPENSWKMELPATICLDIVPFGEEAYCVRPYGFSDGFRGTPGEGAVWMGQSLEKWSADRSLNLREAGIDPGVSIQELPLFPVVRAEEIPKVLDVMLKPGRKGTLWLKSERVSARTLSVKANLERTYGQRQLLMARSLQKLARNHEKSIFYYLDLEKASADFRRYGIEIPPEISGDEPVTKRISDSMFRARIIDNEVFSKKFEQQSFGILRESMIRTLEPEPVTPGRNVLDDQILWGRSPVRLDLAGGWTDTPPYCIMEGGKVVNLSVELNGQLPLQVFARPLGEFRIILRSIDLGEKMEIDSFEQLNSYDKPGGVFSIPLAALVLAGFGTKFSARKHNDLKSQLKAFGCGIEMSLLAAIPKGSGLGTSSNLAATVLGTLNDFCGLDWDRHAIAYRTLILEQMLTTGGGWQDQYGGIFQGIKLLETAPGIMQYPGIKWLPDQLFSRSDTRQMMLLYYTGVTRVARDILGEIVKAMFLNANQHLQIFSEMKIHASETFNAILGNSYERVAKKVAISWELNQRLDEGTNPPVIQHITGMVDDLLLGYKLLGAGGGGYLLMFAKSAEAAARARKVLESEPPNARARFVDFTVSATGFQVSRS